MPHQSLSPRLRKRLKEEGDLRRPTQEQISEMVERRTRAGAITEGVRSKPRPPKRRPPDRGKEPPKRRPPKRRPPLVKEPPKRRPPKRRPPDRAEEPPKRRPPKRRRYE